MCPCCGEGFEGEAGEACASCGARRVGPPLAAPERLLPSYGHALAVCAAGLVLVAAAVGATVGSLFQFEEFVFDAKTLLRAAEIAAWRLKWTALPAGFLLTGLCSWLYARMRREPSRFVGHVHARLGLVTTAAVTLVLAALIGITVPERLHMRELGRRAAENAVLYETDLALARYRKRFGTYPAALTDLRRLEDADGSIARLLAVIAPGEYKPETDLASLSIGRTARARGRRRVGTLPASAADTTDAGIALTNYGLTLPGRDGLLGTVDDLHLRDGRIHEEAPTASFIKAVAATPTPSRARSN
ncbi:MAG: hypothetical protein QOH49_4290 [Acidobacteriota bacterium]|jgi:hypothetical protein|nr:hypothetical protein [Acidobacteriota bacterium]